MDIALVAVVASLLGGCPDPPSDRDAVLTPKDVRQLELSTPVSPTATVCHVVLLEEGIGNRWLLQFRSRNGLVVVGATAAGPRMHMTLREYASALDEALSGVEDKFGERPIDQVQLDVKLVDEAWRAVVEATTKFASKRRGIVRHEDPALHRAIVAALGSTVMSTTCDVARRHRYSCDGPIGLNPIAFKTEHVGKPWTSLGAVDGAGLNERMWVGMNVKKRLP